MTLHHLAVLCALALAVSACSRHEADAANGIRQTKFPGQITAGGQTSGQVLTANAKPITDGTYAGGTPGIAGGSGGNTGGAAMGGTVQESGQGPSSGTVKPESAGRPGTTLPAGDMGKPATPSAAQAPTPTAVHRDPAASSAAPSATSMAPVDPAKR